MAAVQRGLLLGAREGPGGLAPALLAEDEAHLGRGPQAVGMIGPERRARLVQFQRAQALAGEEALLARDLLRPLGTRWRGDCGHDLTDPFVYDFVTGRPRSKRRGPGRARGPVRAGSAKRRFFVFFPQIPRNGAFSSPFAGSASRYLRDLKPVSLGSMGGLQILVTGVSGYVGAALVPRLVRDGHAVRGFARSRARTEAAGGALDGPRDRRRDDRHRAWRRRSTASTSPTT